MSLLDTASLIVTPNGYKEGKLYSVIPSDGSGDLSVVRATTATRVNSAGLVELVPYNRFQYSEDFTNAIWSKVNTTITSGQTDPFGTSNASRYLNTANGGFILQSGGLVVNEVQTISAWVKSNTGSSQTFIFMANSGAEQSPTLTATNQWQRVTWTFTSSANNNVILFYNPSASLDLLIYGTQLVEGSTAKDYQKTETRLNIPRLDYSNGTCPSLLVEPQRTNSCLNSSNYSAWLGVNNITITANTTETTSPFGINNASKIVLGASGFRRIFDFFGSVSGNMTISVFVKPATSSSIVLLTSSGSLNCFYDFNTQTTTPQAGTTATITEYENGWYRITATASLIIGEVLQIIFQGNGGDYLYLFGVQTEAGSYSTSYIPTTSASVTRNADVISKTGISSLIGQTEGVVFLDFVYTELDSNGLIPITIGSNSSNHMYYYIEGNERINFDFIVGGSDVLSIQTAVGFAVKGTRYKIALAYKANDFAVYINGALIGTQNSGAITGFNDFYFGYPYASGYSYPNRYNAAALWKTRLTNAQLATLTTI
jgi:hypothetical protein